MIYRPLKLYLFRRTYFYKSRYKDINIIQTSQAMWRFY